MIRYLLTLIAIIGFFGQLELKARDIVVADSITHIPLPNASVYDCYGNAIGISNENGVLPSTSQDQYPITIRYIGFYDKSILPENCDTIFLIENASELPEVVVKTHQRHMLHVLAYIREYSTLSTYTDTVFLFREKMVDYMLKTDRKVKFSGWSNPRILTCKSYYRFTNEHGLDSVSNEGRHHFSWSDWIGLTPKTALPNKIRAVEIGTDTIFGKYSPTEVWIRENDRVALQLDVLADTMSRKWVPNLAGFFRRNINFEKFKVKYNYNNVISDSITALDLTGYSFNIESNGRGHEMFRFNRIDEPFFVSTQADVYILDKEYITVKEAKKWEKRKFDIDVIGIYEPLEAPALSPSTLSLIDRVNNIKKDDARLNFTPEYRIISNNNSRRNFKIGRRALTLLKNLSGVTYYRAHKNFDRNWDKFKRIQPRDTITNTEQNDSLQIGK